MRKSIYSVLGLSLVLAASVMVGRDRRGPMSGTWNCQAHGGSQGDMVFTLFLQQNGETVDGSISSPIGGTQITSGTFRKNMLEIHLDTPQGAYSLMAKYAKGKLTQGVWSTDNDRGIWEGTKQAGGGTPASASQ